MRITQRVHDLADVHLGDVVPVRAVGRDWFGTVRDVTREGDALLLHLDMPAEFYAALRERARRIGPPVSTITGRAAADLD